jgi:hypothetical protein
MNISNPSRPRMEYEPIYFGPHQADSGDANVDDGRRGTHIGGGGGPSGPLEANWQADDSDATVGGHAPFAEKIMVANLWWRANK